MATLPLDVCPANPPHALPAPATTRGAEPANDNAQCWTRDRRARLLLASIAARPPLGEWKRTRYIQSEDERFVYVGYRAEALDAIRIEHGDRAHAAFYASGEDIGGAFAAWCHQPTSVQAIDAVLEGR